MKIVKLTFNYDWPIFRQTPNFSQIWGDYKFIIDDNLKECDFWIVYTDYKILTETVKCNPENVIFIPGECYNTSPKFAQNFLNQFGAIITVQREIRHKNIIYSHNANPWFIGKSFDELNSLITPVKTKLISVVSSNKAFTEGHRKRIDFVKKLKEYFGDQLDVYGRGIVDFEDKWDVLADYKYSIAIENDYCEDWVTEKFFDCLYTHTLPFYYGCPNLESIVNKESFIRIDINDFESSVKIIEDAIKQNQFDKRLELLKKESIESLNRDNFFPFLVTILDKIHTAKERKINFRLKKNEEYFLKLKLKKIMEKIINKLIKGTILKKKYN
ncbi:glycosyltransferase family 10 domain-containing protein [Flavobacterium sp. FlaQc-47]|uniref:glycosyltransferase family 10 domain-containing protein n=1 Tax=Flavobacterium sp. FlaQc-47 TaxID=3374180 RepID=UPI0037574CD2